MAQSLESYISGLGLVTRYVLLYILVSTALVSVGVLSPMHLLMKGLSLEMWRPFTAALFFGQFSMPFIMTFFVLATYLNNNEKRSFSNKPVDFLWMLFLLIAGLGCVATALGWYFTSSAFLMSLCWVFCKRNPADRLVFWGFEFGASYFPWVLMAFNFILSQSLYQDLAGIAVGHAFIFFTDILPATHGYNFLRVPQVWYNMFLAAGLSNEAAPSQRQPVGHTWGRGRTLAN